MKRAVAVAALVILGAFAASTAAASPIALLVPQGTAFAYLGHSCGGIQEQSYATGFAASGYPAGDVYVSTRCGGSGRGGGYHTTTYSAWLAVTWDFAGTALTTARLTGAPSTSTTFSATDANGDRIYNAGTTLAYLSVPAPAAPTGVAAAQTGFSAQVTWTPATPNPNVILSSTITATPVGSSAPVVTAAIAGPAASGLVGPLQPSTTYQVTVASTTSGGTGPASVPVTMTTVAASIVPSAPTGLAAHWLGGTILSATWNAATGGNAPVDAYQVQITGSDGGGTFTQTVSGATLWASFTVNSIPNWTVKVRAHNAAGWSAWSARVTLGGL